VRDFQLNLIRKHAGELLDQVESYSQQLAAVPNEFRRKQLVNLIRWFLQRIRDLLLVIENEEPE